MHTKTIVSQHGHSYLSIVASNDLTAEVPGREWNNAYTTSDPRIGQTVATWINGMRAPKGAQYRAASAARTAT